MAEPLEIFLIVAPGFEPTLAAEARAKAFTVTGTTKGGVTLAGDWPDIWRANLSLRGATRVLVRLASFRVMHLAKLDAKARKLPWAHWLRPDRPIRVDATCRKSRIYHDRAAAERVQNAIAETLGAKISKDALLTLKVRIDNNLCTISLDTTGEALHKRGSKAEVNRAPMRETMASLFLAEAGFDGAGSVYDPMCGSGTFVIEAAEIAAGLDPGRNRAFAFEHLAGFDPDAYAVLKTKSRPADRLYFGSDRDKGAIRMSTSNAERAGVAASTAFDVTAIRDVSPPTDEPGLVIVNPPYGARIGDRKPLFGLYNAFGRVMRHRFAGWRVAMIASDGGLAKATELPFDRPGPPIDHGGIKVRLYRADL